MRLLYVDEAGISDPEPFLVVAGVVVHADDQLRLCKSALDALITKWIPADKRDGFVFHAKELFNGGGKVLNVKTLSGIEKNDMRSLTILRPFRSS